MERETSESIVKIVIYRFADDDTELDWNCIDRLLAPSVKRCWRHSIGVPIDCQMWLPIITCSLVSSIINYRMF